MFTPNSCFAGNGYYAPGTTARYAFLLDPGKIPEPGVGWLSLDVCYGKRTSSLQDIRLGPRAIRTHRVPYARYLGCPVCLLWQIRSGKNRIRGGWGGRNPVGRHPSSKTSLQLNANGPNLGWVHSGCIPGSTPGCPGARIHGLVLGKV